MWTICRIFKRTVSYKKYVPDISDSSLFTKIKRNPIPDSTSCITYSSDQSDARHEQCSQFQAVSKNNYAGENPGAHHHMEVQQNHSLPGQFSTPSQANSLITSYHTTLPNSNTGSFHRNENWDELGAVVEFALDPSTLYDCSY